ncbi:hypothetical protein FB451DRAFT_1558248 [Mycena latifolia]|nr:hypothetical protein FB451DRAFT_1558248 [Mycena latifolia]
MPSALILDLSYYARIFVITFVVLRISSHAASSLVDSYPGPAAWVVWAGNELLQATTALALITTGCTLYFLGSDVHAAFTTAGALPTRRYDLQLEGVESANGAHRLRFQPGVCKAIPVPARAETTSMAAKIWLICNTLFAFYEFYHRGVISADSSLLENVVAVLLFILHGLWVVVAAYFYIVIGGPIFVICLLVSLVASGLYQVSSWVMATLQAGGLLGEDIITIAVRA